jgi:hypothetical protein
MDNDGEADIMPTIPDYTQAVTMTAILPSSGWTSGVIRLSDNNIDFVTYQLTTAITDETMPAALVCNTYPNPFNPNHDLMKITLTGLNKAPVTGAVYNLKGQCVKQLSALPVNTDATLTWDGSTDNNSTAGNGIYLMKIGQGTQSISKKIIVIR